MDITLLRALVDEARHRRPATLVTVIETKGSVPRHTGSAMLVRADGSLVGTVGGGRGEAQAREAALKAISTGQASVIRIEMLGTEALGNDMICGGVSSMLIEPLGAATVYKVALEAAERGERSLLVRSLPGVAAVDQADPSTFLLGEGGMTLAGQPRPLDVALIQASTRSGNPLLADEASLFLDPLFPEERLLILGGGHVGLALATLAKDLGFTVSVGDDRAEFVAPGRFPEGINTLAGPYSRLVAGFPFDASTYAVVMTQGHLSDLECVRALIAKNLRYLGFIGSSRKVRLILEQLKSEGFDKERVEALHAPIGIDIGAETPEEISVSILAELIAVRRRAPSSGSLRVDRMKQGA